MLFNGTLLMAGEPLLPSCLRDQMFWIFLVTTSWFAIVGIHIRSTTLHMKRFLVWRQIQQTTPRQTIPGTSWDYGQQWSTKAQETHEILQPPYLQTPKGAAMLSPLAKQ